MFTGPLALIAITAAILVTAGQLARRRLRRRHPPTGELVDIGGYRLHADIRGSGPSVVLEGGTWAPAASWGPIQAELATVARVVAYDRAGLGWSDRSPRPRTADVMAEELRELLARADVPAPYVLVGHSFGGTIVRVFAHRYPADVAAVVLLDGAHEDQFVRAPEALRAYTARTARMMPLVFGFLGGLVRLGVVALRPSLVPALGPLPADAVRKVRAQVAGDPKVLRAMTDEMAQLEAGNERVRELGIRSLGDLPIRVISHGRAEGVPAELGPELAAEYEELWQELQVAQASLSSRGSRTIADGVGHNIPWEAPGLVVDTVRGLLVDAAPAPSWSVTPERPSPTPGSS